METISRDIIDAAWLAGIIDGEGWIGLYDNKARRHRQMKVSVGNTNPMMLERIGKILQKLGIKFYYQLVVSENLDFLTMEVSGNRNVYKLLSFVVNELTAKADQARTMLEYLEWRFQFNDKGPVPADVRSKQDHLRQMLSAAKRRKYSLQRLPRKASEPINAADAMV